MSFTIYWLSRAGERTVVTCVDDLAEVAPAIVADRRNHDQPGALLVVREDESGREDSFLAAARRAELEAGLPLIRHDGQDGDI